MLASFPAGSAVPMNEVLVQCWPLCLPLVTFGKVCETLLQQGGSGEAFLMQGEKISVLAHREPE